MDQSNMNMLGQPLQIGKLVLPNRVFLAPMSGVTDRTFRDLAHRHGAGLVVSEMIAGKSWNLGDAEMQIKALRGEASVHCIQLAGRDPCEMAEAARMTEAHGADIIDINMGCPAKKVVNGLAGSALMRDEQLALQIVEAVVRASGLPVTLKMRLGWDDTNLNAPQIARRAVDAGVQMITVHGRTRCQFYKGVANWSAVQRVRDAISVPLIVNGDIACEHDARMALEASGADGVMVGRASYGRPWLPGLIAGTMTSARGVELSLDHEAMISHHEAMLSLYGREMGVRHARKHLASYLENAGSADAHQLKLKKRILTSKEPDHIHEWLRAYFLNGLKVQQVAA